jgi:hypothetical protein
LVRFARRRMGGLIAPAASTGNPVLAKADGANKGAEQTFHSSDIKAMHVY